VTFAGSTQARRQWAPHQRSLTI